MAMETSLYHDEGGFDPVKKLKRNMTLDFTQPSAKKPKMGTLLGSPDMKLLQLASPELERLIIGQQHGMVTTTPTPTQFIYPQNVTEQQEDYARGFVLALEELHQKDGPLSEALVQEQVTAYNASTPTNAAVSIKIEPDNAMTIISQSRGTELTTLNTVPHSAVLPSLAQSAQSQQVYTTASPTTSMLNSIIPTTCVSQLQTPHHLPAPQTMLVSSSESHHNHHQNNISHLAQTNSGLYRSPLTNASLLHLKEEPQIVPCSPPVSPINMETQEVIKLERKRERNRVAARKCRTRKLERISRLEERVDALKGQNSDLSTNARSLRDQVAKLKRQIMDHVDSGCKVMLQQDIFNST